MRRGILVAAGLAIAVATTWFFVFRHTYELAPPASLDVSTWETEFNPAGRWFLRYPPDWHLQRAYSYCAEHDRVVVSNVGDDLVAGDAGTGCTDLWDMRELPRGFVVVQLEEPGGPPVGPRGSQRTAPLSLDDAERGARSARFGIPHGLWFPVYLDQRRTYIVRAWFGPDASEHDREIAERIVSSIRFDLR